MANDEDRIDVTDRLDLDFEQYAKRPLVIEAVQIDEPFKVDTLEGDDQHGKPGDYLVVGIEGERYPVDEEIFEETYRTLDPEDVERPGERREWVQFDWHGDIAGDISDALTAALRTQRDYEDADKILVERIHVEVESDPRMNGAEVVVVERDE